MIDVVVTLQGEISSNVVEKKTAFHALGSEIVKMEFPWNSQKRRKCPVRAQSVDHACVNYKYMNL